MNTSEILAEFIDEMFRVGECSLSFQQEELIGKIRRDEVQDYEKRLIFQLLRDGIRNVIEAAIKEAGES